MTSQTAVVWILRLAIALTLLSAVADRFGLWGPHGLDRVAWGDMPHFMSYTAKVNSFAPAALIPFLGWSATLCELGFGLWLLIGVRVHWAACGAAILFLLFATAMTISFGVKSPLDYSVFVDVAAAYALAVLSDKEQQRCKPD